MSNESNNLDPIVAGIGFNDGANKGFWRHQPRDAKKRWMEMGAEVRALFNKLRKDGTMGQVSVVGRVAGSTGSADQARVLIQGDSEIPDGIYAINSDSLEAVEAHLSDEYLKSQGIDPNSDKHGNPIDGLQAQDFDTTERADITQDDLDLVNQGADSEKGKEMSKFKDSSEGKAVDAADVKPSKAAKTTTAPSHTEQAQAELDKATKDYFDAFHADPKVTGKKKAEKEAKLVELAKTVTEKQVALTQAKRKDYADSQGAQGTPTAQDSADKAISDAWEASMGGNAPKLDTVINAAQGPGKAPATKKLIDLNPGDQIINNKGDVFTYVSHKSDGNGGQRITLKAADGTTAATVVPSNHQFKMAPKSAPAAPAAPKKAANAKPVPSTKPATTKQIDELDKLADQVANDATIDPSVKKNYDDLVAKLDNGDDVSSDEAKTVLDQVKTHFGQKTTPKTSPTIVQPKRATATSAPAAPAAAKPLPDITKKSASEIALAKKRMDDGSDIALDTNGMTEADFRGLEMNPLMDENGKPLRDPDNPKKIIQDPNAIINTLLEQFPNARVSGDNDRIILERRDYTDVGGKEYKFEMGVSRTYGNQFIQQYKFTDKATGEVQEFQTRDYKDSFAGLFGKTNGLVITRDQLLGEKIPGKKLTRELNNFFGPNKPLEQRLKYFRKGSNLNKYRLVTPQENIKRFLDGMDVEYNLSTAVTGYDANGNPLSQVGNVVQGQVSPFWEAMEKKDWDLMKQRLTQTLGRMPDTPESRKLLTDTLRTETIARFKGEKKAKSFHTYANLLDRYMASNKVDLRDVTRTPYIMGDGTTVAKKGDKVIYFANHDRYSVGTIVGFQATNGKNNGYHDSINIMFADGTIQRDLQTRNAFPAGPDSEFGDPALTSFAPNVQGDAKLALRKAKLGAAYDKWMAKRKNIMEGGTGTPTSKSPSAPSAPVLHDDGDGVDDTANPNAGAPYIDSNGNPTNSNGIKVDDTISDDSTDNPGSSDDAINTTNTDGTDKTPPAPVEGNVTKLQPNDSWYDEDGNYKGIVFETQEVPATDGGEPGIAVYYIDENGDEDVEVVEKSEDRGPK